MIIAWPRIAPEEIGMRGRDWRPSKRQESRVLVVGNEVAMRRGSTVLQRMSPRKQGRPKRCDCQDEPTKEHHEKPIF